jgi:hypothetical protein
LTCEILDSLLVEKEGIQMGKQTLAITVMAACLLSFVSGCGDEQMAAEESNNVVYLCKETKKVVRAPLHPTPAVNPETGRKTLFRALYCSRCKKWHAIPPSEERSGNPLRFNCPRHKSAMSLNGPVKK